MCQRLWFYSPVQTALHGQTAAAVLLNSETPASVHTAMESPMVLARRLAKKEVVAGNLDAAHRRLAPLAQQSQAACSGEPDWSQDLADDLSDLGAAYLGRDDLRQAVVVLQEALHLRPSCASAHYNMAVIAQDLGDPAAAVHHYRETVRVAPQMKPAWQNLAQLLHHHGFHHEADSCYRHASGTVVGHAGYGRLLVDQGRIAAALGEFRAALLIDPGSADALEGLAVALLQSGAVDEGVIHYHEAIAHAEPQEKPRLLADLSKYLERVNRLEQASCRAHEALTRDASQVNAHLTLARIELRDQPAVAVARLAPRHQAIEDTHLRARALFLLGQANDKLGGDHVAAAFDFFLQANKLAAPPGAGRSAYDEETLRAIGAWGESAVLPATGSAGDHRPIVFLLGFPRSGATLLQSMLSGHPQIVCVEEKPTLAPMLRRFVLPELNLDHLAGLDEAERDEQRRLYWQALGDHLPASDPGDGLCIIDKQSIASAQVPLLARLFPEAKFLFAVRDPRDVCMSCFMQDFHTDPVMEYFRSPKETAQYYAQVMGLLLQTVDQPEMAGRVCRVLYEQLLEDPRAVLSAALEFMGLAWDESVLDRTDRLAISTTPSDADIGQPLRGRGIGRWRKYSEYVGTDFRVLVPSVNALGYGSATSRKVA